MPYPGEFAHYGPLNRISESERVKGLLRSARVYNTSAAGIIHLVPRLLAQEEATETALPLFAIAIDGSQAEVSVKNGYPGARVGYCSIASVLLDLERIDELDKERPINPVEFRKTEESTGIDAAFPGSNIVVRSHTSAKDSFRESLYENFKDVVVDDDKVSFLDTYEALLALKPTGHDQACPYESEGCTERLNIGKGISSCSSTGKPIYSTDALRIHERFRDFGSNGEALGEVMQVWERILLVHLLRGFERRNLLEKAHKVAFIVDGPLAIFGHPAWISKAISKELRRINSLVREKVGTDLIIIGIEKSGEFAEHFFSIDETEKPGELLFSPGSFALPTDEYIKKRIIFSESTKRYGLDTYFGRKFLYKTRNGYRLIGNLAFLSDDQDTLESDDIAPYLQFPVICRLLDKLVSSRYPDSLSPIVSAHAQAAIPLHLGNKVLEQLAKALMRKN